MGRGRSDIAAVATAGFDAVVGQRRGGQAHRTAVEVTELADTLTTATELDDALRAGLDRLLGQLTELSDDPGTRVEAERAVNAAATLLAAQAMTDVAPTLADAQKHVAVEGDIDLDGIAAGAAQVAVNSLHAAAANGEELDTARAEWFVRQCAFRAWSWRAAEACHAEPLRSLRAALGDEFTAALDNLEEVRGQDAVSMALDFDDWEKSLETLADTLHSGLGLTTFRMSLLGRLRTALS